MKTTLTPEHLGRLAAEGRTAARRGRFVDPAAVMIAKRLLRERGEEWAASVLMRPDLSARRSTLCPEFPWLEDGDMETLALADRAEFDQIVAGP